MVDQVILNKIKNARNDPSGATLDNVNDILEFIKQISKENDDIQKKIKDMSIVVQIIITDRDAMFWVKAYEGDVDCGEGNVEEPSFTFSANFEIVVSLLSGKITAYEAYMESLIKVEGNLQDAMIFQELVELATKAYLILTE